MEDKILLTPCAPCWAPALFFIIGKDIYIYIYVCFTGIMVYVKCLGHYLQLAYKWILSVRYLAQCLQASVHLICCVWTYLLWWFRLTPWENTKTQWKQIWKIFRSPPSKVILDGLWCDAAPSDMTNLALWCDIGGR